jgi:hypothetical protein
MRRKFRRSAATSRSRRETSSVAVEVVAIEELTPDEENRLRFLERKIERAFFEAGQALAEIQANRLYRGTHLSFSSYCRDKLGFTADSAYLKIAAAEVYENIRVLTPTNGRCHDDAISLPTNERQVRPIVKAKLEPTSQVEVWLAALEEAGEGKIPSSRIVKSVVDRLLERTPVPNPFQVGEICQILAKDNVELRGKGGCWCIVTQVNDFSVTVNTFDNEYHLRPQYLKSLEFSEDECLQMEELGARMSELYEKELEEVAQGILNKLARIDRSYLTELEEKLLVLLEKQYKLR